MNEKRKMFKDDFALDFANYDQLSYTDTGSKYISLLLDGKFVGKILVYTDRENESREYICVNYEVIYLDTIKREQK